MAARLVSTALVTLLALSGLTAHESRPSVRLAVAPKYPALTLAGRVYGEVSIRVVIDRSGNVRDADVLQGHPMLRDAALFAARQWEFAPSSAATRSTTLKFSFVLLPDTAEVASEMIFLPPFGFEVRQKPPSATLQDGDDDAGPQQHSISQT